MRVVGNDARRSRWSARTAVSMAGLGALLMVGCGSSVDGSGSAAPGEVAAYRSELSASVEARVRAGAVELCRESMSSMVVMVRGYNAFIARLNTTHSYPEVGDLDEKARASLIAGADQIRPKITETSPAEVADPARSFLDSTARLENAIGRELRTGLNSVSARWTRDKQRLLDACGGYTPLPAASSATPRPPDGAADSSTAVPPTETRPAG